MESATAPADEAAAADQEKASRVSIEISDHVAEVRLTRPDKHNGLDYPMFEAINDAITELGEESSLRAVVLSGEGKSFCAGLDFMSVMAAGKPIEEQFAKQRGRARQRLPARRLRLAAAPRSGDRRAAGQRASAAAPRSRSAPTSASPPPTSSSRSSRSSGA